MKSYLINWVNDDIAEVFYGNDYVIDLNYDDLGRGGMRHAVELIEKLAELQGAWVRATEGPRR